MCCKLSIKEIVTEVIKFLEESEDYQQPKFEELFIPNVDFLNPEVCNLKYTNKSDHTRCALSKKGRKMPTCEKLVCAGIKCVECICDIINKTELNKHIEGLNKDKKSLFIPDIDYFNTIFYSNTIHCTLFYPGGYRTSKICSGIACKDCICSGTNVKERLAHIEKLKKPQLEKGQQVLVSNDGDCIYRRILSHAIKSSYFTFAGGQTEWTSTGGIEEWRNCKAYHK